MDDGNYKIFENVGEIETTLIHVPYHDVVTLDGVRHIKNRYTRTDHTVTFFNLLNGDFEHIISLVKSRNSTPVRVGFPDNADGFVYADYTLKIVAAPINKGYLRGNYYRNGVKIAFEAVNPDE